MFDRLPAPRHVFHAPSFDEVAAAFRRAHRVSEAQYRGRGVWGKDPHEAVPSVRRTSRRVIGYCSAAGVLADEAFLRRAREGCEYLLSVQRPDGPFPWLGRGLREVINRDDGMYETGIAGVALLWGYRLFGDERYLAASRRAADWECDCPISRNNNYNMFAAWHLAELHRVAGDRRYLDEAVRKTKYGGMPGQLFTGGWPGHNSWIWYHGIILRGMGALWRALPEGHPFKAELRRAMTGAIGRVVREQEPSGRVPPNPGFPADDHVNTIILHGMLHARAVAGRVADNAIFGMMRCYLDSDARDEEVAAYEEAFARAKEEEAAFRAVRPSPPCWTAEFADRRLKRSEWGDMPDGWFNAWYPCRDVSPSDVRWELLPRGGRDGGPALSYRAMRQGVFAGLGCRLPDGKLVPGRRYAFRVWCRGLGNPDDLPEIWASVYSGPPRPEWDCASGCTISRGTADFDAFREIWVEFDAAGSTTHVYLFIRTREGEGAFPPDDAPGVLLERAEVVELGAAPGPWRSPLPHDSYDTALMALGEYLGAMFGARA